MDVSHKKCTKCGVVKQRDSFYSRARNKNGLHPSCKECMKIARRNARPCCGRYSEYVHFVFGGRLRRLSAECAETDSYCAECEVVNAPYVFYHSSACSKRHVS